MSLIVTCLLPLIFIFYYVGPLNTILVYITNKKIYGKVFDCKTGTPIENAVITISGVGWGFRDNLLVWDKVYSKSGKSDAQGNYSIEYNLGTEIIAEKTGYLHAYDYGSNKNVNIRLLDKKFVTTTDDRTYNCKLYSECYKEVIKNDVTIGWDSCANPNYKP